MSRIASLPMYDFRELRAAHDRLWEALAQRLRAAGIDSVPDALTRHLDHRQTWAHPGLLFGQACEYPLMKSFDVRLVATPCYGAPGCVGATYRSAILVRAADPAKSLEDLRNRRCVINEPDSNSGMNLLRAAVAPFAAAGGRFFRSVEHSGSHRASMELLAAGAADVTAIDCVTLAHLERLAPQLAEPLRRLDWTPASPCLPYVTSRQTSDATVAVLRSALAEVFADDGLAAARGLLFLDGVDVNPDTSFSRLRELEAEAQRRSYRELL